MASLAPPRPHQQVTIDQLRQSIASGHRSPMTNLPTGGGKTVIAAHVITGARSKGRRVAFCVPSLSLIDQSFARFAENGIDPAEMGVIQGSHAWRRPHAPIQICSAQTLARRELPDVDLVIIDEAHVRYAVYDQWMSFAGIGPKPEPWTDRRRPIFIGLSATPGAKGLGKYYDDLIRPTTTAELIELGYLSPFKVFAPSHPDLAGIKTVAGDYHEGELGERMSHPKLVADVVATWLARAEGRRTLCFGVNRAHAQKLTEQFAGAGVPTAYVDAETSLDEREAIGRRLGAREILVVVNIGCLTTGVDWQVECISLCRPTKSRMLFVQIIGRGLRTAPDKQFCQVLDHSDTTMRLGFVTDIHFDELDDGKPKKSSSSKDEDRVPLPRECGECTGLVPPGAKECPCCGAVVKRHSGVETAEGELVEMTSSTSMKREKPVPVIEQLRAMGKPSIIGQLYTLRDERGRSDGWVAHQYREIFGVWPRGFDQTPALEPTNVLRSWVRSRAIAYAKKLEKQREQGEVVV